MYKRISIVALFIVSVTGLAVSAAGVTKQHRRARSLYGIPSRDYQHGSVNPTIAAISMTAELVEARTITQTVTVPPLVVTPRNFPAQVIEPKQVIEETITDRAAYRYFQLPAPVLRIDHCEISQVALVIDADGHWTLSLRADQNRQFNGGYGERFVTDTRTGNPKQTSHIKRNRFHVKLRCFVNFSEPTLIPPPLGKPVVAELCPPPFWVQRDEPYSLKVGNVDKALAQYFDRLDRIEVVFTYD